MATSYQQLWEQQKKSGVSQTKDGGTVSSKNSAAAAASASANQQASSGQYLTKDGGTVTGAKKDNAYVAANNAVTGALAGTKTGTTSKSTTSKSTTSKSTSPATTSAIKQSSTGVYKTKDGGTVTGQKKTNAYTPKVNITPETVAASAYEKKLASLRAANKQTDDDDDYETIRDKWKNDAIQSHYDTAGIGQYRTRDNGIVTQPENSRNPYTGATESGRMTLDRIYTPTADTWQQDAGINTMLNQFRGNTNQLYYTNEAGQQVAFPMQNLNLGNGRYVANVLSFWDHPDNEVVVDSHGNRMTLGNLKQGLANGYYADGNEGAYNSWINGVVAPASTVNTISGSYSGGELSDSYLDAILEAQQAQTDALNQALAAQRSGVGALYDQNAADLYANYRRSGLAMPEQLAGTATGMADSYMLQNDLNFQNNLNTNELERIAAMNDLDAQAAQNQANADLQAAQTAAEWAQMMYQNRQNELAAEREYQLAMAKANNSGSSGNGGYSLSELSTLYKNGVISLDQYRQMAGFDAAGGGTKSAQEVIDDIKYRYGNSITQARVMDSIDTLYNSGQLTLDDAKAVAKQFGMVIE